MLSAIQHIEQSVAKGAMAVWTNDQIRLEVGKSLSGYHAFKFYGQHLIAHHSGLTANEAAALVESWLATYKVPA